MNTATTLPKVPKFIARKVGGNDAYSWAVYEGTVQRINGLTRAQVPSAKRQAVRAWCARNGMDYMVTLAALKL